MSNTVIEYIPAQLVQNGKSCNVKLKLSVTEHKVDESAVPVARTIERYELVPISGLEDGSYTLRYLFNGKQKEDSVRVQGDRLLAG